MNIDTTETTQTTEPAIGYIPGYTQPFRILNLYAGIGGNRAKWGNEYQITAVEFNAKIAEKYSKLYPNDTVIVADAHQYLLEHFKEFDFIWSSPPCQSHTRLNTASFPKGNKKYIYPDMTLYQQIILLKHFFHGKYVIENVIPYYEPLIYAVKINRHLFWLNFQITSIEIKDIKAPHEKAQIPYLEKYFGFDLSKYEIPNKRQILRNCVIPEIGKHFLDRARNIQESENTEQKTLF